MRIIKKETERLILREFKLSDARDLYELNSDPEILRYTGDSAFDSLDDASNFISHYDEYERSGFGRWAVLRKEDKAFIGWCGLKLNEEGEIDLGFRLKKKFWGKGYATESAKECIRLAFEDFELDKVIARSAKENLASMRVIEKLKMKFVKSSACHGIPDAHYYVLKKKDYLNQV